MRVGVAHCGGRTLDKEVPGIIISVSSLEAAIMEKSGPIHQGSEAPGQTTNRVGTQLHTSANRLPLITPRDKALPTRGIRISSTYQWAGTSPIRNPITSPCINFTHKGADTRIKRGYNPLACIKETTQKLYKVKSKRNMSQMKEQDKAPEDQLSEVEIGNLFEKDFRVMLVKAIQDLRKKMRGKDL